MIKQAKVKVIRGKWYREVFPEEGMGKRQWVCINDGGKPMRNTFLGCSCPPSGAYARLRDGKNNSHLVFEVEIPDPKPTSAAPTTETWTFKGRLDVERVVREAGYRPCVIESDDDRFAAAYMTALGCVGVVWFTTRENAEEAARSCSAKPQKYTVTVLE